MKITGLLPVHNSEKFIDLALPLILRNLNHEDELVIVYVCSSNHRNEIKL